MKQECWVLFTCTDPSHTILAENRKEAINYIRSGKLNRYENIVVSLYTGECFNLASQRGRQYFGTKG